LVGHLAVIYVYAVVVAGERSREQERAVRYLYLRSS
jgi:hypothetical protein